MWVIQNAVLLRLPDDVPVPPNSRVIGVPEDFEPRDYQVENNALVKVKQKPRATTEKLTADEVRQIKAALLADELFRKRRKEDR